MSSRIDNYQGEDISNLTATTRRSAADWLNDHPYVLASLVVLVAIIFIILGAILTAFFHLVLIVLMGTVFYLAYRARKPVLYKT